MMNVNPIHICISVYKYMQSNKYVIPISRAHRASHTHTHMHSHENELTLCNLLMCTISSLYMRYVVFHMVVNVSVSVYVCSWNSQFIN